MSTLVERLDERARLAGLHGSYGLHDLLREAAAALRATGEGLVSALDVFRIAGGDVECSPNPSSEQALDCLRDLRDCYDEALREANLAAGMTAAPTPAEPLRECADDACNTDREVKMVTIARNEAGKSTVWCDPCIAPIVKALNDAGIRTIASCCGHRRRPGSIVLEDRRELIIARDFDEARRIDTLFPATINDPLPEEPLRDAGAEQAFNAVWSFIAEWHADVIRCLEDVSTEMRARGRGDERFQRLIHRMPRSVIDKIDRAAAHPAPQQPVEHWRFVEQAYDGAKTSACERVLEGLGLPSDEPHMPLSWHINRALTAAQEGK